MRRKDNIISKINTLIFFIIVIFILSKLYGVYRTHYFNGFMKAEYTLGTSKFIRDKKEKYSEDNSYKIATKEYSGAVFYKNVKVKPNTPYKVKCMVKTENIATEKEKTDAGANICILNTTETSKSITGTNDWQQLEFMFNSKNRENVEIAFRIGGNQDNAKGTAWFSDFVLEEGYEDSDTNWNMVCFIFKNIDVKLNVGTNNSQENLKLTMRNSDIETIKDNMRRFEESCEQLSNNKINIKYDIYEIDEPIDSISYSEQYGYYIDPTDIKDMIEKYMEGEEYDYIFSAVRLGDLDKNVEIPVYDWIGLRWDGFIRYRFFKYKTSK